MRNKHIPKVSGKQERDYAGSSKSGTRSNAQMEFNTSTQEVSIVQFPINERLVSHMNHTIENAMTDPPLLGNIGMQYRCQETSFWCLVGISGVHIQVHQEYGTGVFAFRWLARFRFWNSEANTPSMIIFQNPIFFSDTYTS